MSLSDEDIRHELATNQLRITPCDSQLIQPASVDLRLGTEFLIFAPPADAIMDVAQDTSDMFKSHQVALGQPFDLQPNQFVLACTYEWVGLGSGLAGQLAGKSSLARCGIIVHFTAGYVDPGWEGQLTFEIMNFLPVPIRLYAGMKIGQMVLTRVESPAQQPYGVRGHYQRSEGPQASRYYKSWDAQVERLAQMRGELNSQLGIQSVARDML